MTIPTTNDPQQQTAEGALNERTEAFLEDVGAEIERARIKFPGSRLVLAALTEEVGELAQAMLKVAAGKWRIERVWEEAMQVAAMAARVATEGDPSFEAYEEPDD